METDKEQSGGGTEQRWKKRTDRSIKGYEMLSGGPVRLRLERSQ